jgi:hypothetical protein
MLLDFTSVTLAYFFDEAYTLVCARGGLLFCPSRNCCVAASFFHFT